MTGFPYDTWDTPQDNFANFVRLAKLTQGVFYVSAIAAGCGMIIFESFLSSRAFNRGLELDLLTEIARVGLVMLGVYAVMTVVDLADRKALPMLFQPQTETYFFWFKKLVGGIAPFVFFFHRRKSVKTKRGCSGRRR